MKDSAKKIKEKVHEGTRTPFEFSLSVSSNETHSRSNYE